LQVGDHHEADDAEGASPHPRPIERARLGVPRSLYQLSTPSRGAWRCFRLRSAMLL
jgi:hypothetical protein